MYLNIWVSMMYLVQVRSQRKFGVAFSCSLAFFIPCSFKVVPGCVFPKLLTCRDSLLHKKANSHKLILSIYLSYCFHLWKTLVQTSVTWLCILFLGQFDEVVILMYWWDWRAAGGSFSPSAPNSAGTSSIPTCLK